MKVVMIADSESYNFLVNPVKMLEWREEFINSNEKMVLQLRKW